ncbi:glycerol uptake facilitator related permease (major Intrinsic protein family) [Amylolactobacillus amylotrophicus DSM 20534]|uniref:Glycerol uptake facilitator related permease (Major Intrinsic protein family) n=3 Tax=Amylolactobacillus TaxID=2767876 RepID=A0A0R1YNX6_9LACO|nr:MULTISPECIES: MIP/aquaporin family protein [Amylolactobacillus]APT18618.1 aquaporin [Amylolactobacillus amylophilus DSM 20533 = JCM 1125]KRK37821.1 glycerol uptake facilitator related permease (major Intrinsic protein family) [Amylolactobacillus amylotrophicus DSM 20534]KRM41609.1 glycerol uptake facilitator related permease (major Intrinsic protein family) [Amylolactobacillus amylophilus DSM 20533 = JCM 1125]GED80983.1 glycerol uptake facilitator protein [Amylolactobacillus amylophilus]
MGDIFVQSIGEFIGTLVLVLLGDGVVAGVSLKKSKSEGAGWIAISLGWGFAVIMGVYVSGFLGPAHLNPAVTIGMAAAGKFGWSGVIPFIIAQVAGAFLGAVLVWIHYYPHWQETKDQAAILGTFATGPAIRNYAANFVSEVIGTFMLVFALMAFTRGRFTDGLNPLVVGALITSIGLSLGGTTGYAINPARDFGPRLAHAVLPIANKGGSDWSYSWVPIVGDVVGGLLAAGAFLLLP